MKSVFTSDKNISSIFHKISYPRVDFSFFKKGKSEFLWRALKNLILQKNTRKKVLRLNRLG